MSEWRPDPALCAVHEPMLASSLDEPARECDAQPLDVAAAAAPANALPEGWRLSVVMPVYNERATLVEIVRRVQGVPLTKEIIIVDDGSTDGTRDLLQALEGEQDVRVVYHEQNQGKGAAVRTGFLAARGDIVLVQDADLEYDPRDYPRLIEPIVRGEADVVFGSRFLHGSTRQVPAYWHTLANRLLTTLSNMVTGLGLSDMETCYKVFRGDVLRTLAPRLQQRRFGIEPELAARVARGKYRLYEVAISYRGRGYAEGKKIGWRDGVQALWCILRYWRVD
jgi:glycosyltransferase involved in cell wall biosynthesis